MPAYRTREAFSRSLEVSTDAQLPPQVSIVSPTPRAFTFSHDIHFTSPSRSPFDEPELKQFSTPPPVRTLSPTSSIASETTTSSSFFSSPSAASSQASHRRRRSVAGDNERRPKRGDEDYIKRPENAFILFRRKCCEERQQAMEDASSTDDAAVTPVIKKQRQADLSKQISQQWKSLSAEERAYWEDLAKEKKKEHEAMYPNYVYRPQRTKDKKGKKGKNGKGGDPETDAEGGITFVMPVPSAPRSLSRGPSYNGHSQGRRAVSAPTPPPAYQTIRLPTLSTPFCATSPSSPSMVPTLPRISRRVPVPNFEIPRPSDTDPSTHYEYVPEDTLFPSTFERMNNYNTTTTVSSQRRLTDGSDDILIVCMTVE
ncbi:hypothetical protein K474DRAFT_1641267 [Panus rudis PR-1116 ss-1]|nr:hypothetical protein K474DRAFT_1641267 [Panus rudis PR-1116 ss-1]